MKFWILEQNFASLCGWNLLRAVAAGDFVQDFRLPRGLLTPEEKI
jgi:hypothetical protein